MTSRFAVQSTSSPVIESVNIRPGSWEVRYKLTIAGNDNRVGSNSHSEEGEDTLEEVHDLIAGAGGMERVEGVKGVR